ncbi:SusC/RagA family TonB-linked outer membrane protein [Leptobacterium flavescens]|uniref:SusC/RagA family TonB-linked outer membrane protein n=1 Tax=Leptobacterium flavescens TaxID=472055 RepID=A0A6P0UL16_9FLAO|nr:SusC/RagA family TonB-linked outer membrane protein [Leptobacterium flavescens]NER13914.1 SusC/RagA family TonB-linked outer membrane protein [Leptobacterium flavescens]
MRSYLRILLLLLFGFSISVYGQKREISGIVTDTDGIPLAGANIVERGTSNGTITDFNGRFSLEINVSSDKIGISFIGYQTLQLQLTEKGFYEITLSVSSNELSEVIVTALGMKREEKALGYAVQKLKGSEVSTVKSTNLVAALAGKLSGVYITGSANGPTASANINIRGTASLLGNNQPLFVVNGLPITNRLNSFDDGLNGSSTIDFGNAAQLINADDIASVNILKGPATSALYGSRAANGVVLIQTKTGRETGGQEVEFNSSTTFESILKLPDYQNTYGFGGGGKYSYLDGTNYIGDKEYYEAYGENWGPEMNGQLIKQFNSGGQPVPFTPAADNVKNFFRTGISTINNVSINNYKEDGNSRLSYTNLFNEGIMPNTGLKRNTVQVHIGRKLLENKLNVNFNAIYTNSVSDNIPNAGYDESSSVMYGWLWFPRQVKIGDLRDYWTPGQEGVQQRYVENLWVNNPWFIAYENTNAFKNNRIITHAEFHYDLTNRIFFRLRYGADILAEERQYKRAPSTKAVLLGSYREDEISFNESNAEFLFGYQSRRNELGNFNFDIKAGGNLMRQRTNLLIADNPELEFFGTEPGIYSLANARSGVLVSSQKARTGINSLFGLVSLSYLNRLFLDLTYRNDWNSTLVNPGEGLQYSNYSFGYPSVALSALLSDFLALPETTFLKLKTSYAEVGNGAPAFAFDNTFTSQPAFGNQAVFSTNRTITDPDLTNERTKAYEFGLDMRLWSGRLKADLTYYNMLSFDQVIFLPVSKTSGYDFNLTNGGEIRNKGIELTLAGRLIDKNDFSWDITFNAGRNRAIVESLPDAVKGGRYSVIADLYPGDEGGADLEYVAEEGKAFGQLYGLGFERGPDGRIIHENGLPLLTKEKVSAGSFQPDWRLGIYNSFKYKSVTLGFLLDGQLGGKIYSRSHALYATGGAITNNDDPNLNLSTLQGRTVYSVGYDSNGDPVYTLVNEGGVIGPGWKYDPNGQLVENDVVVPAGGAGYTGYFYNYYGNGFNRDNIEAATYDATYFKLRELSLTYKVPELFSRKIGISRLRVSLIGRNLFLWSKVPTIDPETFSIRNGIFINGFESTSFPSTRSIGIGINAGF